MWRDDGERSRARRLPARPASRASYACLLFLMTVVPAAAEAPPGKEHAPLFDGSRDVFVRSAYVPSSVLPQGEVRLVRRGNAVVMQTVLHTRFLGRVVAEIGRKERALWPETRNGRADSLRYVEALEEARRRIEQQGRPADGRGDRRRALLIEFVLSDNAALVGLFQPDVAETGGHLLVAARRPLAVLELSRTYVRGNIYEIARDALSLTKKESKRILDPLLPGERPQ